MSFPDKALVLSRRAIQVHKARLKDGTPVAVKVQYAGLETSVAADVTTFQALSALAAWALPDYQVLFSLCHVLLGGVKQCLQICNVSGAAVDQCCFTMSCSAVRLLEKFYKPVFSIEPLPSQQECSAITL